MRKFSRAMAAAIDEIKYLKIRSGDHRFTHVWVVVVDGRVCVRSWNAKRSGWHAAFRNEPRGHIVVNDREIPVRGIPVRSAKLNDAVDRAYPAKYTTEASQKYNKGFRSAKRKATTTELIPR